MSRPLILVASGGLGRETAEAARAGGQWDPVGFVDDDPGRSGTVTGNVPVLGGLDAVRDRPEACVVICAGNGASRLAIAERLAALGVGDERLATVVHPTASIGGGSVVGAGSVLLANVVLTAEVRLGQHVVCMPNLVLTHDDVIEDGATLCAGVMLGGGVRVGRGSYLGMASSVRENVTIGAGSVVGMGAVVLNDVPERCTVVGVPAAQRRERADARSGM
jgi:sugar O-acyltransferase (sialic acid O-acetyltransferase NeuD family)